METASRSTPLSSTFDLVSSVVAADDPGLLSFRTPWGFCIGAYDPAA
jgi:hypothetical protein